jgi:phospholipid/cholesterol/gamma-HCH transport system substrate-binding protein
LPEANRLVRDLRDLSDSLRQFSDRLNNDGAMGVLGPEKLPDYKPGKTK